MLRSHMSLFVAAVGVQSSCPVCASPLAVYWVQCNPWALPPTTAHVFKLSVCFFGAFVLV